MIVVCDGTVVLFFKDVVVTEIEYMYLDWKSSLGTAHSGRKRKKITANISY